MDWENIPNTVTPPSTAWTVVHTKFWNYHLNVADENKTHRTRQQFSSFLSSIFEESGWVLISVTCEVVFCCCSLSAPSFQVTCVQRWQSANLVVTIDYLGYRCFFTFTNQYACCPLTSTMHLLPHKCSSGYFLLSLEGSSNLTRSAISEILRRLSESNSHTMFKFTLVSFLSYSDT